VNEIDHRRHLDLHGAAVVCRLMNLVEEAAAQGVFPGDEADRRLPSLMAAADELAHRGDGMPHASDPLLMRAHAEAIGAELATPPPLARLAAFADPSVLAPGYGAGAPDLGARTGGKAGASAVDVVVTAMLVEHDVRVGAAVAALQGSPASRRPCVGLLARLLGRGADEVAQLVAWLAAGGFLVVENPDEPRADQTVRLAPAVQLVLDGTVSSAVDLRPVGAAPDLDDLVLPADVVARVERAAALLTEGELDALVVRGAPGTGRRSVLQTVAAHLGLGLLVVGKDRAATSVRPFAAGDSDTGPPGSPASLPVPAAALALPPFPPAQMHAVAVLAGAAMAWVVDPGLGQLVELPGAPAGVPVGVVTGRRGAVQVAGAERAAVVELPMPDPDSRRRFWTASGFHADDDVLETVSRRFVLSGGTIRRVAAVAGAVSRLDGRDHVTVDDVRMASREQGRQQLESLATLLPPLPDGFRPVLAGAAAEAYDTLALRCRHRENLAAAVDGAIGGLVNRGVRAMLSGPSGTGKTLSARALGARLGLDVYRADLAALVDKYIGETERRLDNLFGAAEELDVVLLVDEGDALMTRRTDVRSSNDRYANLETDYLLQRLESYEGIVLITTNAPHLVDTAFQRRLDVTVGFNLPGPAERLAIWQGHLPARHGITPATLERLATACRLTGGQIRNAAVHATLLAVDADGLVDDRALVAAVERELTVAGKTSPLGDRTTTASSFEQALAISGSLDGRNLPSTFGGRE
jgi:ATPase family protein associated with various cellular activities (AAA)